MPTAPTYPGVYIEEVPSGVRTITGVATSITAFIGRARKGPVNEPTRIQSFADFERVFGGLWIRSTMSYAVQQYFRNGGADAIVVRIQRNADSATITLPAGAGAALTLEASSPGEWGTRLRSVVDHDTGDPADTDLFNLTVMEMDEAKQTALVIEVHRNLSIAEVSPRFVTNVLQQSALARVSGAVPAQRPDSTAPAVDAAADGDDGDPLQTQQYQGSENAKTGIFALEKTDLFNLLCIPPIDRDTDISSAVLTDALSYIESKQRRAMLLVDAPSAWNTTAAAVAGIAALGISDKNAAVFFPRIRLEDPLSDNQLVDFAPSGAVAGVFARTDAQRGVWKAPAGLDATVRGVLELTVKLTDGEHGQLNPLGVSCLRAFPSVGHVVWGSRTMVGADRLASEWKYIPVRRVALFLEESLYRGTQWVVFEPNDEPLWAQIRLNVGAFMQNLFRQGAFQGTTPREAYFVKCDKETTTQNDINLGIVNILVGFAPLKPAEFVVIRIQQMAGEVAA
jgi:phage tail sheath protein FI